jgi:hypothetical protein
MSINNEDRTRVLINLAEEMYSIVGDLPTAFTGGVALAYLEHINGREVKRTPGDIDIVTLQGYLPEVRKRLIQTYRNNILRIEGERRNDISRIFLWSPYNVEVELFDTLFLNSIEVGKIRIIDPTQILALKLDGYLYTGREKDLIDIYRLILLDVIDTKDFVLMIRDIAISQVASPENIIEKLSEKIDTFSIFDNSEKGKIKEAFDIMRTKLKGG